MDHTDSPLGHPGESGGKKLWNGRDGIGMQVRKCDVDFIFEWGLARPLQIMGGTTHAAYFRVHRRLRLPALHEVGPHFKQRSRQPYTDHDGAVFMNERGIKKDPLWTSGNHDPCEGHIIGHVQQKTQSLMDKAIDWVRNLALSLGFGEAYVLACYAEWGQFRKSNMRFSFRLNVIKIQSGHTV